jgi:hypothetical protein
MSIIEQKGSSLFIQTIFVIILLSFLFAVIIHVTKDDNKIQQQSERPINLEPFNPNNTK